MAIRLRNFLNRCLSDSRAVISNSPSPKKILKFDLTCDKEQTCPAQQMQQRKRLSSSSADVVLRFTKSSQNATTPTKGSKLAAGYDLYSAADCVVPSKGKALVPTDIKIELPHGCYGRIAPRSGLAHKHFIDVGAGVIDEDYRGNVGVILFNFNNEDYQVNKGDRIAQLICEKIFYPEIVEVDDLSRTDRGAGGYGSTGKN